MFGLGFGEILVLATIGLIVLGPKQLQQVARVLGKTIFELKKAMNEVSSQVRIDLDNDSKSKPAAPLAPQTPLTSAKENESSIKSPK